MNDLKKWRDGRKISQVKFAKMVRTTQPHLSAIENDATNVSQVLALRIFDETGIKVGPLKAMTNPDIAVVRRLNAGAAA